MYEKCHKTKETNTTKLTPDTKLKHTKQTKFWRLQLIFQCLPIVADIVHKKPRGSSIIVVISPLRSLMEDQVRYLTNLGIPAIAITNDEDADIIQQVSNGDYIVVFGSPECC